MTRTRQIPTMRFSCFCILILFSRIALGQLAPDSLVNQVSAIYTESVTSLTNRDVLLEKYQNQKTKFESFKTPMDAIDFSIVISKNLSNEGIYVGAIDILKTAQNYLQTDTQMVESKNRLFTIYNSLGVIYISLRDNKKASEYYLKALKIAESTRCDSCMATISNNLGEFYLSQNDFKKTEQLLQDALIINEKLNRKNELRANYTNLGVVNYQLKQYNESENYYKQAMALLDTNDLNACAILNLNISQIYKDKKQYPIAEAYLKKALELANHAPNSIVVLKIYLVLAKIVAYQGKKQEALELSKKALLLSNQLNIPGKQAETFRTLTDIYLALNDSAAAIDFMLKYEKINDSINEWANKEALNKLLSVYEVEHLKQEKRELEQSYKIKELVISRQKIIIAGGFFIFILLAILIFSLYNKMKSNKAKNQLLARQKEQLIINERKLFEQQRKEMELEIDFKNRQLTTFTLDQVAKNEFHRNINEKLEYLRKLATDNKPDILLAGIDEIIHDIIIYSDDHVSEEFKTYFDSVHPSFFENLAKTNPNLTANELRLCAFLRMGLSTKEIAALTFREIRSVESARNRLRKKLELNLDENLLAYLSQF